MFKVGEKVKITSNNISGIIYKKKKNNYTTKYYITVKGKTIILDDNRIEKETSNLNNTSYTPKLDKYTNNTNNIYNYKNTFIPEITIRHQTLDIAMYNVENFITEAINLDIKNIKIIHGRNGGVLRKAVHEYLKHNKNVESYRLGNYYEGSYGVTIIKLK